MGIVWRSHLAFKLGWGKKWFDDGRRRGDYNYWNLIRILNFRFPFVDASVRRSVGRLVACVLNLWYFNLCGKEKIICLSVRLLYGFPSNTYPFPLWNLLHSTPKDNRFCEQSRCSASNFNWSASASVVDTKVFPRTRWLCENVEWCRWEMSLDVLSIKS